MRLRDERDFPTFLAGFLTGAFGIVGMEALCFTAYWLYRLFS